MSRDRAPFRLTVLGDQECGDMGEFGRAFLIVGVDSGANCSAARVIMYEPL